MLPSESLERLQLAIDARTRLTSATTVTVAVQHLADESDWDLFVVDPDLVAQQDIRQFLEDLPRYCPPILVYTPLTRTSAATIGIMAEKVRSVLFKDFDDGVYAFRRTLREGNPRTLGPRMVGRIAQKLDSLPVSLRRGTVAAFCAREPITSVKQLARITSLSRRSVDRWFRNVGLGGGKLVLSISHFLRAYSLEESKGGSLKSVAISSGYGSPKALQQNSLRLTGKTFRGVRASTEASKLLNLLEGVLRGAAPSG